MNWVPQSPDRFIEGIVFPTDAEVKQARKQLAAKAKAEREREQREAAKYWAKIDEEIDAEDEAERLEAERVSALDPVERLRDKLDREAAGRAAVRRGEWPSWGAGSGIRADDRRRRREQRAREAVK